MATRTSSARLCGEHTSECHYCNASPDGRVSWGFVAGRLSAADYQALCDRNWRRSGTFVYKPANDRACCCQYTIRLDAPRFAPSKAQRRVDARMRRLLLRGDPSGAPHEAHQRQPSVPRKPEESDVARELRAAVATALRGAVGAEAAAAAGEGAGLCENRGVLVAARGRFSSNAPAAAAAFLRRSAGQGAPPPDAQAIASRVAAAVALPAGWRVVAQHAFLNFHAADEAASNAAAAATEAAAATGSAHRPAGGAEGRQQRQQQQQQQQPQQPAHSLAITVSPSTFVREEFELYKRYQIAVHHDDPSELSAEGYERFLVESPLARCPLPAGAVLPYGVHEYGSYHMQYRLDGELIAVGVLDVLPGCLSSVYFFYDPSRSALDLGVFSALTEVRFVQEAAASLPELRYYYMGYYIHTCQKMRYKGAYSPSDLLCELTWSWVPLDDAVRRKLDEARGRLVQLSPSRSEEAPDPTSLVSACKRLPLVYEGQRVPWDALTGRYSARLQRLAFEFVSRLGLKLANSFELVLS
eukprot:m51a1_g14666 putative arginyl-trna--protein transferase 1-like (526) ;mRNA; f:26284-27904